MQAGVKVEEKDLPNVIAEYLHKQNIITSMASAALNLGKPEAANEVVNYIMQAVK
jgi:UDP-N-acetylglucosamine:LPS N-acetylglucosamine transferase